MESKNKNLDRIETTKTYINGILKEKYTFIKFIKDLQKHIGHNMVKPF